MSAWHATGRTAVWRHWTNSRPANKSRIYRCINEHMLLRSILLLLKALFTCGWTDGIAVQIAAAALVLLPYLAWSKTTLLTNLALCTLYACWHMTLPDTGSQAQLSERGLSPSAVHAHGCALKTCHWWHRLYRLQCCSYCGRRVGCP